MCKKALIRKRNLRRHLRILNGKCTYVCNVCNKVLSSNCILITHQGIHSDERPYVCDICKNSYSDKGSLMRHELIHVVHAHTCVMCVIMHTVT